MQRSRPATPHCRARSGSATKALTASANRALEERRVTRVVVHQQPGLTLGEHLRDAADVGGHHRRRAGHRLQVHDAQRLVHRRADEHCRGGQHSRTLPIGSISRTQNTPDRARASSAPPRSPRRRSPGCPARRRTAPVGPRGRSGARRRPGARPLLPGDPADERHDRALRVDAELGQHRVVGLRLGRIPDLGVDAVVHHVHPVGVQRGIGPQHVARIPELTAITASAASKAVRSTHDDSR